MTGNASSPPVFATINGCNVQTGAIEDPAQLPLMHSNRICRLPEHAFAPRAGHLSLVTSSEPPHLFFIDVIPARSPPSAFPRRRPLAGAVNPFGDAAVLCHDLNPPWSGALLTFAEWTAKGHDNGTTIGKTPPMTEVVALAKTILGF